MAEKIYTKTGDLGSTSLLSGTRVSKNSARIDAYGTVDELNSNIGLVLDYQQDEDAIAILREIQDRLFTIGSELSGYPEKKVKMAVPDIYESDIELLEKEMDRMDAELPALRNFILPGGAKAISVTHIARCVCRRAERRAVALHETDGEVNPLIIKYLNRLSDYLFMLARYTGFKSGSEEIIWRARV